MSLLLILNIFTPCSSVSTVNFNILLPTGLLRQNFRTLGLAFLKADVKTTKKLTWSDPLFSTDWPSQRVTNPKRSTINIFIRPVQKFS